MKKTELKQLIKPLVKECIHEVLLEEGLLSNVVSEVAKGLQGNLVVEAQQPINETRQMKQKSDNSRAKMKEHRQKLMNICENSDLLDDFPDLNRLETAKN